MPSPDSHDDDLEWILARLSDRGGASHGVIVRFSTAEEAPVLLAQHSPSLVLAPAALHELCAALRPRPRELQRLATGEGLRTLTVDLRPHGAPTVRVLYLRFAPAAGVMVVAAICRSEVSFNLLHELVASRLQPVLERYIRLWWLHRSERRRADVFQRTLDDCELGVAMLDRGAGLRYANSCTLRLLDRQDGLQRIGTGVGTVRAEELPRFQRAIHHAMHQASAANAIPARTVPHPSALLTVSRANKRALIVSFVGVDRPALDCEDTAVVLYVLDPEHDVTALLEPAYRIYRLTGAEARLVSMLVRGADLAAAAASMNLALHTARSYLKQVFIKTATNRQAELVRVMCGSAARAALVGDLSLL